MKPSAFRLGVLQALDEPAPRVQLGEMSLVSALSPLIDVVLPPRCPLCGGGIAAQAGLCATCWSDLAIPGEPCCASCQRPFGDQMTDAGGVCAACLQQPPAHHGIAAATLYNEASRRLVLSLKHGRRIALAHMMAKLMAARLSGVGKEWLLVPVPLHRSRLWHRSFNQAALLAGAIGKQAGLGVAVDALIRRKATPSLGGLGANARRKALAGAIAINPNRASIVKGASIVLVDDVLTSGATSAFCIAALKKAGAQRVKICCFARVLDEALDDAQ